MSFGDKTHRSRMPFSLYSTWGYKISMLLCLICENIEEDEHLFSLLRRCAVSTRWDLSMVVEQMNGGSRLTEYGLLVLVANISQSRLNFKSPLDFSLYDVISFFYF